MRAVRIAVMLVVAAPLVWGCGQSPECRDYVACQRAYDDDVVVDDFDVDGRCWQGVLQTAQQCTQRCIAAREALAQLPDAPAECRDDDAGP